MGDLSRGFERFAKSTAAEVVLRKVLQLPSSNFPKTPIQHCCEDGILAGPKQDAAGRHCLFQPLRELHRRGCSSQGSPPYGGSSLVPVPSNEPNVVWSAWVCDLRDWVHGLHR